MPHTYTHTHPHLFSVRWSSWHNITYASFRIFSDYDCLVRMEFLGE